METPSAVIIPKEQISGLRFPMQPVHVNEEQRRSILDTLQQATRLGNAEHGKCRIFFQDDEGLKAVETTVWTYDMHNIVLKYGLTIPISRVVRVDIP